MQEGVDRTCVLVPTATNFVCLVVSCRRLDSVYIIVPWAAQRKNRARRWIFGLFGPELNISALAFPRWTLRCEIVCGRKDNGRQGLYAPTWRRQAPERVPDRFPLWASCGGLWQSRY